MSPTTYKDDGTVIEHEGETPPAAETDNAPRKPRTPAPPKTPAVKAAQQQARKRVGKHKS